MGGKNEGPVTLTFVTCFGICGKTIYNLGLIYIYLRRNAQHQTKSRALFRTLMATLNPTSFACSGNANKDGTTMRLCKIA